MKRRTETSNELLIKKENNYEKTMSEPSQLVVALTITSTGSFFPS